MSDDVGYDAGEAEDDGAAWEAPPTRYFYGPIPDCEQFEPDLLKDPHCMQKCGLRLSPRVSSPGLRLTPHAPNSPASASSSSFMPFSHHSEIDRVPLTFDPSSDSSFEETGPSVKTAQMRYTLAQKDMERKWLVSSELDLQAITGPLTNGRSLVSKFIDDAWRLCIKSPKAEPFTLDLPSDNWLTLKVHDNTEGKKLFQGQVC